MEFRRRTEPRRRSRLCSEGYHGRTWEDDSEAMRSSAYGRSRGGMMRTFGVAWMVVHALMAVLVESGRQRISAPPLENTGTKAWQNFQSEFRKGRGWRSLAHAANDRSTKGYGKALREFLDNVKRCGLRPKSAEDWDWAPVKELDMMCYAEQVSLYRGNNLINGFCTRFRSSDPKSQGLGER